jgi:hypothetical protein
MCDENLDRDYELDKLLSSYSREQREEMLADIEGYKQVPVDIDTFIEDDRFLGRIWGGVYDEYSENAGQPRVFPFWRDVLREIYPTPFSNPFEEINITGGIGIGKTTVAIIGIMYDIYKLILQENPQNKYSLPGTAIMTAVFTAKKELASSVLASGINTIIQQSPFFSSNYSPVPKEPTVIFPNKIGIVYGSQFGDTLGQATFQAILDEANFQGVRLNQAIDNYNNLKRRQVSRFLTESGLPGKLWVLSSKKDDAAFLEEHINSNRGNPKIKIIEAALWESKRHTDLYTNSIGNFQVYIGDETKEPMILDSTETLSEAFDISRIIDVPLLHKTEFETDLIGSLRDIAGRSSTSSFKLFRSVEQINRNMVLNNIFTRDVIRLDEKEDGLQLKDFLDQDEFWKLGNKQAPHFIHMDLALGKEGGDTFGMAMCHSNGVKEIQRRDPMTGKMFSFQELIVYCDFAIGIRALPGYEVPYFKIREFLIWLRSLGFNLGALLPENMTRTGGSTYDKRTGMGLISADDKKASADMLQELRKQGFETAHVSVDVKKDPYLAFKRAMAEDRVFIPKNKTLLREMLDIEDQGKKLDHPISSGHVGILGIGESVKKGGVIPGSKDILDSLVASYYMCMQNSHSSQLYSDRMISDMKAKINTSHGVLWNNKFGQFVN